MKSLALVRTTDFETLPLLSEEGHATRRDYDAEGLAYMFAYSLREGASRAVERVGKSLGLNNNQINDTLQRVTPSYVDLRDHLIEQDCDWVIACRVAMEQVGYHQDLYLCDGRPWHSRGEWGWM